MVQVPGLTENDLNVEVHGDVLTVAGERKATAPEGYKTHRTERGDASHQSRTSNKGNSLLKMGQLFSQSLSTFLSYSVKQPMAFSFNYMNTITKTE